MYRIYGNADGTPLDEYSLAESAQAAVDDARKWHQNEKYVVIEVAKVVKNWK